MSKGKVKTAQAFKVDFMKVLVHWQASGFSKFGVSNCSNQWCSPNRKKLMSRWPFKPRKHHKENTEVQCQINQGLEEERHLRLQAKELISKLCVDLAAAVESKEDSAGQLGQLLQLSEKQLLSERVTQLEELRDSDGRLTSAHSIDKDVLEHKNCARCAEMQAKLDSVETTQKHLDQQMNSMEHLLQSTKSELKNTQCELRKLSFEAQSARKDWQVEWNIHKYSHSQKELTEAQGQLRVLRDEVKRFQGLYNTWQGCEAELHQKLVELEKDAISGAKEASKDLQQQLQHSKTSEHTLHDQLRLVHKEYNKAKNREEALEEELRGVIVKATALYQQIDRAEKKQARLEDLIEEGAN
ncbi:hypothetical protein BC835DRAFT_1308368 [Cytidiella melzeri]|nr:hypothetical protein BC835DRAFT_1308368 [Cytidiella melzeri]